MEKTISAKELRLGLPELVRRVRKGERFVVLYRSRPAFRIVPPDDGGLAAGSPGSEDSLFGAEAVGRSRDGLTSRDHDRTLYGKARP